MYDLNPGDPNYIIQTPLFDKVTINLENGKNFIINTKGDPKGLYIQSVHLNGSLIDRNYLTMKEILNGGELVIKKSLEPNLLWSNGDYYKTEIDSSRSIVTLPRIVAESVTFKDSLLVSIECENCDEIRVKRQTENIFNHYDAPFYIFKSDSIKSYAVRNGFKSKIESAAFLKFNNNKEISLSIKYSNQYDAGGYNALVDGLKGPNNYLTGLWQGFYGDDFEAVVDLQKNQEINFLGIGAIQDVKSWIWLPKKVEFYRE